MKKLVGISAVVIFMFVGTTSIMAQQKIAHINTDTIVLRMDDYAKALTNVQAFSGQLQKLLASQEAQLKAYVEQVQTQIDMKLLTDQQVAESQQKAQQMQTALQAEALKADQQLAAREQQQMGPVYAKFRTAMKDVAKAKGYAYIVDQKVFLYLEGGEDATQAVATKLGVDLSKPAANVQQGQQQAPAVPTGGGN